jgi:ATP-dependent RNA circularization protein (DNA/RNA ligase family)
MDKVQEFIGILPEYEFCWGSRRSQINSKPRKKHDGFKSEAQGVDFGDVYTKIAKQYNLRKLLPEGYAVYGEIVGWGIQKGYLYNCGKDKHAFYVYDVMKDGKYLNYDEAVKFCREVGLAHVPLLYRGPYIMDNLTLLLKKNVISKEVNEGFVVKPVEDRNSAVMGRVLLKYINDEYLMRDNTEFS